MEASAAGERHVSASRPWQLGRSCPVADTGSWHNEPMQTRWLLRMDGAWPYTASSAAARNMKKKFPLQPSRPELICWGCDKYCATDAMLCGNGSDRTQHPFELFGEDWLVLGKDYAPDPVPPAKAG